MEYVTTARAEVPALGLGTYRLRGQTCTETVSQALEVGYRHIDTAEYYENQAAIGQALADTAVSRDDLFITTKVWRTNLGYEETKRVARESREKLGLETIDLLLIHWPSRSVPIKETITAMNELQAAGDVRHIGVSNFSVEQLANAREASETPICTNQVEYNPYTDRSDVLEYCIDHDIMLTAYSPLAKGRVNDDDTLATIGDRYGKSPAQIALRWLIQQQQVAAIPKASSQAHLEANLSIFDFELTDKEMAQIFDLQGGLIGRVRSMLGL
ncbi:aldo/keto reductase [Haloarcula marismortui]|uniref:Aldo/keto reductase n=1 Tax=Haloarcula marismortui ATCC 33799 TaxID=662475 RepID=M0JU63_9EURY|nr:aldo/keto reductase [Haloarcula californiae]EMA12516.1 aldo/keto reductase [Haloarcula californiae ATCC 33799]